MSITPEQARAQVEELSRLVEPKLKRPRKAKAEPPPKYFGGVALPEVRTGPLSRPTLNLTEFQEAAKAAGLNPSEELIGYWNRHKDNMPLDEARKFMELMLEYSTPKVKPIEGKVQVEGNVSITMVYMGQPPEEKQVPAVPVESEKIDG